MSEKPKKRKLSRFELVVIANAGLGSGLVGITSLLPLMDALPVERVFLVMFCYVLIIGLGLLAAKIGAIVAEALTLPLMTWIGKKLSGAELAE